MTLQCSSIAPFRVFGDDLDPEDVSERLGAAPSSSHRKGDVEVSAAGRRIVRKTGMWCLEASGGPHDSLQDQISRILSGLTSDLEIWIRLQQRFQIDMFCGFFMGESSEGLELSAAVMGLLKLGRIDPLAIGGIPSVLPVSSVVKKCHFHHRGHRVHRDQNRNDRICSLRPSSARRS